MGFRLALIVALSAAFVALGWFVVYPWARESFRPVGGMVTGLGLLVAFGAVLWAVYGDPARERKYPRWSKKRHAPPFRDRGVGR